MLEQAPDAKTFPFNPAKLFICLFFGAEDGIWIPNTVKILRTRAMAPFNDVAHFSLLVTELIAFYVMFVTVNGEEIELPTSLKLPNAIRKNSTPIFMGIDITTFQGTVSG